LLIYKLSVLKETDDNSFISNKLGMQSLVKKKRIATGFFTFLELTSNYSVVLHFATLK
jgi:hypothetical protein